MSISFRKITRKNYEDICNLEVKNKQKGYLSSNTESILDSRFDKTLIPRAIYVDDVPVGFIMGERVSKRKVEIFRFMIDKKHQRKGYGHTALKMAIVKIRQIDGVRKIQICYHPDNKIAKGLYKKLGFREIGMDKCGNDMLAVKKL